MAPVPPWLRHWYNLYCYNHNDFSFKHSYGINQFVNNTFRLFKCNSELSKRNFYLLDQFILCTVIIFVLIQTVFLILTFIKKYDIGKVKMSYLEY